MLGVTRWLSKKPQGRGEPQALEPIPPRLNIGGTDGLEEADGIRALPLGLWRAQKATQELLDETCVLSTAPHTPRAVAAPSGSARYGRPGICPSVVSLMR